MSIVEDALQKLSQTGHQPSLDSRLQVAAQGLSRSAAHELYPARNAPRRNSWPLLGASALLVAGGVTWLVLDRATPQTTTPAAPSMAAKPAPVAAATSAALPAVTIAPVAPTVAASKPAPVVAALAPAVPVVTMPHPTAAAWPEVTAPQWLTQGWNMAEQGHAAQAVEAWESGIDKLPAKNRSVVYALAQRSLPLALAQARRFSATAPALVVRETLGGEPSYRVLLLGDAQVSPLAVKNQLLEQAPYLWVAPAPRFDETIVSSGTAAAVSPQAPATPTSPAAMPHATPAPGKAVDAATPAMPASSSAAREPSELKFSIDDSATKALDALGRGDMAEATRLAETLMAQQPGRWEGHFVQGAALLASGRAREAEAPLDRALNQNPNSARVLLQRAIAAQEAGQPAKAVVWLRQARSLAPETPAVWLNLGYSAELSGATEEAVAAYQRYLQLSAGRNGSETQRAYVTERLRTLGK